MTDSPDSHTIRVIARSKSETLLKLYMDNGVYKELLEHARPLGIAPIDLVRAIIAERFPNAPTQELQIGGYRPKPHNDNRHYQHCGTCLHSWGDHNYDASGDELPDGGPCIRCAADEGVGARKCQRFV